MMLRGVKLYYFLPFSLLIIYCQLILEDLCCHIKLKDGHHQVVCQAINDIQTVFQDFQLNNPS